MGLLSRTGECIEVRDIDPESSVHQLKYICASRCDVPSLCQQLFIDTRALDDGESLLNLFGGGSGPVSLLMLETLNGLHLALTSGASVPTEEALRTIEQYAPKVNQHIMDAMIANLGSSSRTTRSLASKALATVVQKGDEHVTNKMVQLLKSDSWHMRRSALRTLSMISRSGDAVVISAVSACSEDDQREIRAAAATTLSNIATQNDIKAIDVLGCLLQDDNWQVKEEAGQALLNIGGDHAHAVMRDQSQPKMTWWNNNLDG